MTSWRSANDVIVEESSDVVRGRHSRGASRVIVIVEGLTS